MEITKLDAARRQLDAAIELYFRHGDPIAVGTLAYNAFEITATLAKRGGERDWMEQVAETFSTTAAEARKVFHRPRNFFKHADRDPDAVLDRYEDDDAMHLLALAAIQFGEVGERTVEMWSALFWFYAVQTEIEPPEVMRSVVDEFAYVRKLERSAQIAERPKMLAELRRRAK